jgi:hypothetical protein
MIFDPYSQPYPPWCPRLLIVLVLAGLFVWSAI